MTGVSLPLGAKPRVWKARRLTKDERTMQYRPYLRKEGKYCTQCLILRAKEFFWRKEDDFQGMCILCYKEPWRQAAIKEARRKRYHGPERQRYLDYHKAWRAKHPERSRKIRAKSYYKDPQKRRDAATAERRRPAGKIRVLVYSFNQYQPYKLDREKTVAYFIKLSTFMAKWKVWKDSGYLIEHGPVFAMPKKHNYKPGDIVNPRDLKLETKHDQLSRQGKRVVAKRIKNGTDPKSLKLKRNSLGRYVSKAEANQQLEA